MPRIAKRSLLVAVFWVLCLLLTAWAVFYWKYSANAVEPYRFASTVAGTRGEFGEPFGIAVKGRDIYVSDGQNGKIWLIKGDSVTIFAEGFDTPSGIAVNNAGNLIVADSGTHTIKSIDTSGKISLVAGAEGHSGFADGDAASALFNAPIGVAVGNLGNIFVADTYNDRIRVIENGKVSTLAGSTFGFADGPGSYAKFDTPCGLGIWRDKLLVADAGNRRIRVVEPDGRVWTLAGNGELALKDGLLSSSSVCPADGACCRQGRLYFGS